MPTDFGTESSPGGSLTMAAMGGILLALTYTKGDDQDEYPDTGRQGEGAADWKPPSLRAEGKPPASRRQNAMSQVRLHGTPPLSAR